MHYCCINAVLFTRYTNTLHHTHALINLMLIVYLLLLPLLVMFHVCVCVCVHVCVHVCACVCNRDGGVGKHTTHTAVTNQVSHMPALNDDRLPLPYRATYNDMFTVLGGGGHGKRCLLAC